MLLLCSVFFVWLVVRINFFARHLNWCVLELSAGSRCYFGFSSRFLSPLFSIVLFFCLLWSDDKRLLHLLLLSIHFVPFWCHKYMLHMHLYVMCQHGFMMYFLFIYFFLCPAQTSCVSSETVRIELIIAIKNIKAFHHIYLYYIWMKTAP